MKKFGWVVYCTKFRVYTDMAGYARAPLKRARVFPTRREAKAEKQVCDRVRKVELTENGKPKRVV